MTRAQPATQRHALLPALQLALGADGTRADATHRSQSPGPALSRAAHPNRDSMAIGLTTARMTEKLPASRRPCAVLPLLDGQSVEPDGAAVAGTAASAAGPPFAGCAPCGLPTTAVRLCSRRCGDGSARNAEVPPQRGVCGDAPWDGAASEGVQRAPPLLLTAGPGAASPWEGAKQPASLAKAEGLGWLDPLDRRRGCGERRGVRSRGIRSAGLMALTHAASAEAA